MNKKYILIIFSFILVFSSCYKKINLTLPDQDQKVVINGILSSDSILTINITKSVSSTDTREILPRITDAIVRLYKDGNLIETIQHQSNGYYVSLSKIDANESYSLTIIADGKTFNIETFVPEKIHLEEATYKGYDTLESVYKINLKLKDKVGNDYYMINSYAYLPYLFYNDTGYADSIIFNKNFLYISPINDQNPFFKFSVSIFPIIDYSLVFTDELFQESMLNMDFKLNIYAYIDTSIIKIDSLMVYFNLIKINEDLYNYFESYENYRNADGNFMVEPVNVYSNISGGAGLIGAISVSTDSLKVPFLNNEYIYYK